MVFQRNIDSDQITPQLVPSAEFTTCDYSNFPENFDLSLLPGGDIPLSPLTIFQNQPSENVQIKRENEVKMYPIFHVEEDQSESFKYSPDFQKLLESDSDTSPGSNLGQSPFLNIHLEIPLNNFHPNSPNSTRSLSPYSPKSLSSPSDQFNVYRQSGELSFYPSSPEQSFYSPSPVFSQSPRDDYSCHFNNDNISTSPIPTFSNFGMKEENFFTSFDISAPNSPTNSYQSSSKLNSSISGVTNMAENSLIREQMKEEETTIDFSTLLNFHENNTLKDFLDNTFNSECKSDNTNKKPEDHQLLRKALKDTSFQKKYNINSNNLLDFDNIRTYIKMEENEELKSEGIDEQMARTNIEPVLDLAIEQVKKEVNETCVTLGISSDPFHWSPDNVFSWVQWTSRKFNIPEPLSNNWNINGADLLELSEEDFLKRCNQGGMILHAQLEIWKASYSNDGSEMQWFPETASSNASSGDLSEDEDDIPSIQSDSNKPTTTRSSSHIHLWQFLKELLQNSQINGSCIRWLDRSKGIFKIEDSVKVAKLWGKRKNRPAMNYDKLSRSIRQYYKKGIMKKTERSQRLVYQFCSPYNS